MDSPADRRVRSARVRRSTRDPARPPAAGGPAARLSRDGYVVVRSLLEEPRLSLLRRYAVLRARKGTMQAGDGQVIDTPAAYGDLFMDGLLEDLLPRIERASGLRLFPTYSYFRVYKRGDVLARHRDRAACEISVTLALGYEPARPWPLWIEGTRGAASVRLAPGDALLYRGIERAHWRDAFAGNRCVQVFLHYVDRDGPNAGWRFDKRPALGMRAVRRR
jgi:hypothetical protein